MDSFHRKQLRQVIGIRYPEIMSNKRVYEVSKEKELSLEILQARWRLFGHVLRLDPETPIKKAMSYYFQNSKSNAFRGQRRKTLPVTLDNDIKRAARYTDITHFHVASFI